MEIRHAIDGGYRTKSTFSKDIAMGKESFLHYGSNTSSLYVESTKKLSPSQQDQLNKNINLARHLGVEFITTSGNDIVRSILDIGQKENITHIIVGKPRHWNLLSYFRLGNFVNRLIKYSGNIDVYVMGSEQGEDNQYMKVL